MGQKGMTNLVEAQRPEVMDLSSFSQPRRSNRKAVFPTVEISQDQISIPCCRTSPRTHGGVETLPVHYAERGDGRPLQPRQPHASTLNQLESVSHGDRDTNCSL